MTAPETIFKPRDLPKVVLLIDLGFQRNVIFERNMSKSSNFIYEKPNFIRQINHLKMEKLVIKASIILLVLILSSCGITLNTISDYYGIDKNLLYDIPENSEVIIVEKSNYNIDELYEDIFRILIERGHRISKDDKVRHYITTEGIDIGYSTLQRMTITLKQIENKASIRILTEWMAGTDATIMAQSSPV
jgi:hypothetical protein